LHHDNIANQSRIMHARIIIARTQTLPRRRIAQRIAHLYHRATARRARIAQRNALTMHDMQHA
jgi:hypothetical protein